MTVSYEYDETSAAQADEFRGRIDTTGCYIGKFKAAAATSSERTGAQGVEFSFECPEGSADFTVWTRSSAGEPFFGGAQLQAMMCILGARNLTSRPGTVQRYSQEAGKRVDVPAEVFPALQDRLIGIVLQKELYTDDKSGADKWRINLAGVFHPETRKTASEIKDRVETPAKLDKLLSRLKDKDNRKRKQDSAPAPSMSAVPTDI